MIAWTKNYPSSKKWMGYLRLLMARHCYYDYLAIQRNGLKLWLKTIEGYQSRIAALRDKYKGKRAFVLGNGPSLKKMNVEPLRNEITLGSNGIYKMFDQLGFHLTYIFFEDIEQTELRGPEIHKIPGSIKLAALYNAYAFKSDKRTIFFNAPRFKHSLYYWTELYPQFSRDVANVTHLGSTITYVALQFAFHFGCHPVYLIGVDHNYGKLPQLFKPGKITITKDNIDLISGLHAVDNYYKIGDKIGVPWINEQEMAYRKAREVFEANGRVILNAGIDSNLTIFDRCDFDTLFK